MLALEWLFETKDAYRTPTDFKSKIQDFFRFFFKTIIHFSRLKVIKKLINTDLEKTQEQSFFSWRAANIWAILNKIWRSPIPPPLCQKKKFTYKTQHLLLFSRLFPRLENFWANFKTFSSTRKKAQKLAGFVGSRVNDGRIHVFFCPLQNLSGSVWKRY